MKWKDGLKQWRLDRNIKSTNGVFEEMIESQVDEYTEAVRIDPSEHKAVDSIANLMILCANELALMGYDHDLVLKQAVKHISSRKQDPDQAERDWSGEKWMKDESQLDSELYEPNYTICKL